MSGVQKIKIANIGLQGQTHRNVYIYGEIKAFERVKTMINEIVDQHKRLKGVNKVMSTVHDEEAVTTLANSK